MLPNATSPRFAEGQAGHGRACAVIPDRTFPGKVAFVYPQLNPGDTRRCACGSRSPIPICCCKPGHVCRGRDRHRPRQRRCWRCRTARSSTAARARWCSSTSGEGRFEPRPFARRARRRLREIPTASTDGENVVTSANFLIDAESNLRAALQVASAAPEAAP